MTGTVPSGTVSALEKFIRFHIPRANFSQIAPMPHYQFHILDRAGHILGDIVGDAENDKSACATADVATRASWKLWEMTRL